MVITTLTANFASAALFDHEPNRVDAGLCAIGGAVVGGVLAHQLIGKDPATALLGILGGVIGHDYCTNYVNNPRYQALKDLIQDGFGRRPGPSSFKAVSDEFVAGISILRYGVKSEFLSERNCVQFEASVYRHDGRFMGRVQPLWACERQAGSGEYEIMRNSHGIYIVNFDSVSQGGSYGSGSQGSTAGTYARLSRNWRKLDFSQLNPRTAMVTEGSKKRAIIFMNRRGEYGFFAGRAIDYPGIKLVTDMALIGAENNHAPVSNEQDVAVECHPQLNYCQEFPVRNLRLGNLVIDGVARYIFPNGDMFVVDENNGNGTVYVPKEYL